MRMSRRGWLDQTGRARMLGLRMRTLQGTVQYYHVRNTMKLMVSFNLVFIVMTFKGSSYIQDKVLNIILLFRKVRI